ncbi:MAG: glycosyltransferase family 39 protein, partial [Puniceicoccales bacterium]
MSGFFISTMQNVRRLLLFILVGLFAFQLGYFSFGDWEAVTYFRYIGYWVVIGSLFLFGYLLWRAYRKDLPRIAAYMRSRVGLLGVLVALLGTAFLFRAEPPGFRTIMDEHVLASTSMALHEIRQPCSYGRIVSVYATPMRLKAAIDKRPILQPTLVSIVHDLTGYRPYNGVYLNWAIMPLMLFSVYVLAERMGGLKTGLGAVALLITLPLLGYIGAGGGLEPLNLFFIVLTCLLGAFYLQAPDGWRLGAFAFSGILLSQCRYESGIFIIPVGMVIIWSWIRDRRLLVPWALIVCPLFLV